MSPVAQNKTHEYQVFLQALQDVMGVVVGEERHGQILAKLDPVMSSHHIETMEKLAESIRDDSAYELRSEILQAITSNDSDWFSHTEIAKLMNEYVLPGVINQNRQDYRIWMAGCGSGQMAYSLAMTIDAFKRDYDMSCSIEIVATDLSEKMVRRAEQGRYADSMLGGLPQHLRQKHMSRAGDEWEIDAAIRSMLHFKTSSLIDDVSSMGHVDLIICPDMLIYYYNGVRAKILDDFADLLDPSGILIVGVNEAVTPFCKRFELVNHEAGIFYRQLPDA